MKTIKGDLIEMALNKEFDVIAHGCNCFNTMNAGIAQQIKHHFPEAYVVDQMTVKGNKAKLGTITYSYTGKNRCIIINMYTQYTFDVSKKPLEYGALRSCFKEIYVMFKDKPVKIGIPKIGAGLGGGDWDIIKKIIEEETNDLNITCVEFE